MEDLRSKTVLITGSSRGIGAATARLAVRHGAEVVLHGRAESAALEALADELSAPVVVCDVADRDAVERAIGECFERIPRIDVLINNAGATQIGTFDALEADAWHRAFDVNLLGAVNVSRAVVPRMIINGGGRIVNVASIGGLEVTARPRIVAYGAAKAALVNLTAAMAKQLAPEVAVNCVAPGFVATEISEHWNDEAWADARRSLIGRPGEPEELAEVLVFLASPRASFVGGQTWVVDGGFTLAGR